MSSKPRLIIVTGRPGSGKTTLAKKLSELLQLPVLSRDELKETYVNEAGVSHAELPSDANRIVTDTFFEMIERKIVENESFIADAAFQHHVWEKVIAKVENDCDITILICDVDEETAAKRIQERVRQDQKWEFFHGKPAQDTEYRAPNFKCPTITVSTKEGYEPSLESIKDTLC